MSRDNYKTTAQRREDALLDWRNEAVDRANAAEARVIVLSEQLDAALRTLATLRAGGRTSIQSQAAQGAITHDGGAA